MSGRIKQKASANAPQTKSLSINEKILENCHELYVNGERALVTIAKDLNLSLLAPRKQITILLLGNHSAGKSSFINWYIEEPVQKTGVAIETQGFTFVRSGKKKESLTSGATLHMYPHFEEISKLPGVIQYLNAEISTSKHKNFSSITFIDTPGLVDGDMNYPFDVNEAIIWLGNLADLIFVFFDPIGQALCKRTLNVVEQLSTKHADKMRFYLSKADEAGTEPDRQRVMMQVVQELCKRPALNRTGFEMPTIFIPNPNRPTRCMNQIDAVCHDIDKTINQTIQSTLNTLESDCNQIIQNIDEKLQQDQLDNTNNSRACWNGLLYGFFGVMSLLCLMNLLVNNISDEFLGSFLSENNAEVSKTILSPLRAFWTIIPDAYFYYTVFFVFLISMLLIWWARQVSRQCRVLTRKEKQNFNDIRDYVDQTVKSKKQTLYKEYLKQLVGENDY